MKMGAAAYGIRSGFFPFYGPGEERFPGRLCDGRAAGVGILCDDVSVRPGAHEALAAESADPDTAQADRIKMRGVDERLKAGAFPDGDRRVFNGGLQQHVRASAGVDGPG